jgi:aryl-alcohol dehydrogenase-like predicted oxidoreductase
LTGKYRRDDTNADGRWRGGEDNLGRKVTPESFAVIEEVVRIAGHKGCTPSQLALAWNASRPGITAPIIGPRTMEQCIDNIGATAVTINNEDLEQLDKVAPPLSSAMKYYDAAMGLDLRPNI